MNNRIVGVIRSKEAARDYYNHLSGVYDWLGGIFERRLAVKALNNLMIRSEETVLEIGFGTGYCLERMAETVGTRGRVYGLDISEGMLKKALVRLDRASLSDRIELHLGDAARMPFGSNILDAVFMSFTLELFDTPDIPIVLGEVKRVLKPNGRLGVVSLFKPATKSFSVSIYEWLHNLWPKFLDCRPIYLGKEIQQAGFKVLSRETAQLVILPIETVIAVKEA